MGMKPITDKDIKDYCKSCDVEPPAMRFKCPECKHNPDKEQIMIDGGRMSGITTLQDQLTHKIQECEELKSESFTRESLISIQEEDIDRYRKALEEIEKIAKDGLNPICYKSNCSRCKCYNGDNCKAGMISLINNYFTENGEFADGNGDFAEALEDLLDKERSRCNRALPISKKILDIINKVKDGNNDR